LGKRAKFKKVLFDTAVVLVVLEDLAAAQVNILDKNTDFA